MRIPFCVPYEFSLSTAAPRRRYAVDAFAAACSNIRRDTPVTLARSGGLYVFELPEAFEPWSDRAVNAVVLRHLLDCRVALNIGYLRQFPRTKPLMRSGVRYDRTVEWDGPQAATRRKYGDCKSLTCWDVAERRLRGEWAQPVFRWNPKVVDRDTYDVVTADYHILTEVVPSEAHPNGYVDRSKDLGMGKNENAPARRAG